MSSPAGVKWVNGDTEYLPDLDARSGEIRFVPVYTEYRIQLSDQKSSFYESIDIMTEVVVVQLKAEAVSTETKAVEVVRVESNRTDVTQELCSSITLQPSAVEIGMGQIPYQSAYHVWKLVRKLSFVKVPRVHQCRQAWEWMNKVDQSSLLGEFSLAIKVK